jgi:transposase
MQERVTLTRQEQKRVMVIGEVDRGMLRGREGAAVLGISVRHLRRLMAAYRRDGVGGLAHGNRGRKPANALRDEVRQAVTRLASTKYAGFNQQHFTELLAERESICLLRSTVRSILLESGIRSPRKRRSPRHLSRRGRYPKEGMLLQIDGSPHDWLEGRGPRMCLIGAIDDATGKVPYGLFREKEDSRGYFLLLEGIVKRYGIPAALYHDRHSVFMVSAAEMEHQSLKDQLDGKTMLTQFGRAMSELTITSIAALSPQAKGRIERLWETFQDRLVNELRLAAITTMDEANNFLQGFLERYNARFSVPPQTSGSAYRPTGALELATIFCLKYERTVGSDNVVRFLSRRFQILPSRYRASYARCSVEVHEQLDGAIKLYHDKRYLDICPAPDEATTLRQPTPVATTTLTKPLPPKPAQDHPWRRWNYRPNRE